MTKQEKEQKIIRLTRLIPETEYGEYKTVQSLKRVIALVMNYETTTFRNGDMIINSDEEKALTNEIIRRMQNRGIIKISKSGSMFKLN